MDIQLYIDLAPSYHGKRTSGSRARPRASARLALELPLNSDVRLPNCILFFLYMQASEVSHSIKAIIQLTYELEFFQTNKQTNNNDLLEKYGGTKNCMYKD